MKNLSIKKKIILWFALILLLIVFISEGITISVTNQVLNKDARERLMSQVKQNSEEIEYKETPLTKEGLRLADGTKAGQDWLNNYVDRKVRIILAVTDTGKMFIPYLAFI